MENKSEIDQASDSLVDAATVKALFGGRSDMWIWRRLADGTLPPPVVIARRRYWGRRKIQAIVERLMAEVA